MTMVVTVLKIFDLVMIMTQGGPRGATRILAFSMYLGDLHQLQARLRQCHRRDHADPRPALRGHQPAPVQGREIGADAAAPAELSASASMHGSLAVDRAGVAGTLGGASRSPRSAPAQRSPRRAGGRPRWTRSRSTTMDRFSAPRGWVEAFLNSIVITVPATALTVFLAALGGLWLRLGTVSRARPVVLLVVIALMVVPLQTLLVPVLRLFNTFGRRPERSSAFGIAHVGFGLPLGIFPAAQLFCRAAR